MSIETGQRKKTPKESKLREFIDGQSGKLIVVAFSLVFVAIAVISVRSFTHGGLPDEVYDAVYICTETGQVFHHKNQIGETLPILSPYSGKNTGMPAEACYWNADGTIKEEPTWVLLNEEVHKPGPTFCPDCGRLVTSRNPRPHPGSKPPPTEQEYQARRAARAE